jgi:hypothetical protein
MRARRLDDRIRELSAKAVAAKDPEEVHLILSELRATIRQYMQRLKHVRWQFLAVAETSNLKGATPPKNRNSPAATRSSYILGARRYPVAFTCPIFFLT